MNENELMKKVLWIVRKISKLNNEHEINEICDMIDLHPEKWQTNEDKQLLLIYKLTDKLLVELENSDNKDKYDTKELDRLITELFIIDNLTI